MEHFNDRVMPYVVSFLGLFGCFFVAFWLFVFYSLWSDYQLEKLAIQNGQHYNGNVSILRDFVTITSGNKKTVLSPNRGEITIVTPEAK